MKFFQENEETLISLSDLRFLLKKNKSKILLFSILLCLIVDFSLLRKTPEYTAKASFMEKTNDSDLKNSLKDLFTNGHSGTNANSIMLSNNTLLPLIQKLCLNAEIKDPSNCPNLKNNILDNLKIAYFSLTGKDREALSIKDLQSPLTCCDISFQREFPLTLIIRFISENSFTIKERNQNGSLLGKIDVPIKGEGYQCTISKNTSSSLQGREYLLSLHPLEKTAQSLREKIAIHPNPQAKNILEIQYSNRDRRLASSIVNHLMWEYQEYLKKESHLRTEKQLSYLETRQNTIHQKLEDLMLAHSKYIEENLGGGGFTDLQSEANFLSENQNEWKAKLLTLNSESRLLESALENPDIFCKLEPLELGGERDGSLISDLLKRIRDLTVQKKSIKEKLHSLSDSAEDKRLYDNIQNRLSIVKNHLEKYIYSHQKSSKQQVSAIKEQIHSLSEQASALPNKWFLEEKMRLHITMGEKIMEKVTELVENTVILHNLESIESQPVDLSIPPTIPNPPKLILFSITSLLLGGLLGGAFFITRSYIKGVPSNPENLSLSQLHVTGNLSTDCPNTPLNELASNDLETLRRISAFLPPLKEKKKKLLLASGTGPDYSQPLSELLVKRGERPIVLNIPNASYKNVSESEGLLQYLEGHKEALIQQSPLGFCYIPAGGNSPFSTELVCSEKFQNLLNELEKSYDRIVIYSQERANSSEIQNLSQISDSVILSITNEKLHELDFYKKLQSIENGGKDISFIFIENSLPVAP